MTKQPAVRTKSQTGIGFIVVGQHVALFIEQLVKFYYQDKVKTFIIHVSQRAALWSATSSVANYLQHNYNHVIIAFDTDEKDPDYLVSIFKEPIEKRKLEKYVSFCPIEPSLTAWLLTNFKETDGLTFQEIKKESAKFFTEADMFKPEFYEKIDFELMRHRNEKFNAFAEKVISITKKVTKQ
jgi:hypothetical protein